MVFKTQGETGGLQALASSTNGPQVARATTTETTMAGTTVITQRIVEATKVVAPTFQGVYKSALQSSILRPTR